MAMTDDDIIRVAPTACLDCGHTLDAIGTVDGSVAPPPNPGDPIACIRCGAVMTIERGALRGFTDEEMTGLVADGRAMDELALAVRKIHFLKHYQN